MRLEGLKLVQPQNHWIGSFSLAASFFFQLSKPSSSKQLPLEHGEESGVEKEGAGGGCLRAA